MTRREAREHVFRMLFIQNFHSEEELKKEVELYFGYWDTADDLNELQETELEEKLLKITGKLSEIDPMIDGVSVGWRLERMSKIDLTIVRLATYEMIYDDSVPVKVAINEAVELAKKFGGDQSPAFVNGILAKVARKFTDEKDEKQK
ncbi:transcription antitermination factor NusB [Anaerolentibacter hominis]|uniref:transcription antitermination factor NusB n=1 Tax=Anaerolentibacter hominis TaxID=3079009 RepID=UPI0031B825E4